MEGHMTMSAKERRRLIACQRVLDGTMGVTEAAAMLSISPRQMRRSIRRFQEAGDEGLVHRRRGKDSNRAHDKTLRTATVKRYKDHYIGFGPTFAAEKLACDGYAVDHETLRRWLIADGQWQTRSRRTRYRSARERRPHFGELVQFDGSHHDWFEGRRERCCLMQMVDDATGVRMMLMCEQETTLDAMRLLRAWIERYGVPKDLYTDRKSVYIAMREPTIEEQLEGTKPLSAFGLACDKLGIGIIAANSPQAKGRVERANGVAQDRLVKEMRLAEAVTIAKANEIIGTGLLDTRFAIQPAKAADLHRPLHPSEDLDIIFRVRAQRTLTNDYTVRHNGRILQVLKQPGVPLPGRKVIVAQNLDGELLIEAGEFELGFEDVTDTFVRPDRQATPKVEEQQAPQKPGPDHPWRNLPRIPDRRWAAAQYNSQERTFLSSP